MHPRPAFALCQHHMFQAAWHSLSRNMAAARAVAAEPLEEAALAVALAVGAGMEAAVPLEEAAVLALRAEVRQAAVAVQLLGVAAVPRRPGR